MEVAITKEVADAINTLKEICGKSPRSCQGCMLWVDRRGCILGSPIDWPEVEETKTYTIEVDDNE